MGVFKDRRHFHMHTSTRVEAANSQMCAEVILEYGVESLSCSGLQPNMQNEAPETIPRHEACIDVLAIAFTSTSQEPEDEKLTV